MAYGRKSIPPPSTPFEEFMANASKRMIAAKLQFVEALRELPPAAWIAIGVVILVLAASSLNLRGKKKSAADTAAVAPAADAVADVAPAPASTKEAVVEKVEVATDKAEAAAATKVDEAAAAAKTEAKEQVDAAAGKLGVDLCGNQPVCRVHSATTWPRWLGRAARNRHRHAIEQASRRWR